MSKINFLLLTSILLLALAFFGCSSSSTSDEQQEVIDFMCSDEFITGVATTNSIMNEWDDLSYNAESYTDIELQSRLDDLATKASQFYTTTDNMTPPKCLRGYWDKQIEIARMQYETIDESSKYYHGFAVNEQEIQDLIYECNNLKLAANRELQDICDDLNIELD